MSHRQEEEGVVSWERVYTVNDYYDGPRLGVADVFGHPHVYESLFSSTKDDFEDYFVVSPIDTELLTLILEDWGIWMRWSTALDQGQASRETHPALPEDRARHDELTKLIDGRLKTDPERRRKLSAEFRNVRRGWDGLEVRWSEHVG